MASKPVRKWASIGVPYVYIAAVRRRASMCVLRRWAQCGRRAGTAGLFFFFSLSLAVAARVEGQQPSPRPAQKRRARGNHRRYVASAIRPASRPILIRTTSDSCVCALSFFARARTRRQPRKKKIRLNSALALLHARARTPRRPPPPAHHDPIQGKERQGRRLHLQHHHRQLRQHLRVLRVHPARLVVRPDHLPEQVRSPATHPPAARADECSRSPSHRHWRYISSFHGPWLQLPPEVLESLAYSNYHAPRPRPIDPAVFFDLVKIRKYVDEATNLAVRAASGVASSAHLKDGGLLGGGAAGVLGLGISGGGPAPRLSRERKHRMRELATQKLARAYKLDEIAASVATMQSASSLEDVAALVLQRSQNDPDAKYVHFFHEKIPSRMLAKCTPLAPLDHVISERPGEGAPLRTRAVTKVFKEDYVGAAADLTAALNVVKLRQTPRSHDLALISTQNSRGSPALSSGRLEDDDQPSSLESQLLFHRASTYLTIATQHIDASLPPKEPKNTAAAVTDSSVSPQPEDPAILAAREAARKAVRINAKRALRDYTKFLTFFDYTPGLTLPPSLSTHDSGLGGHLAIESSPSVPDREAKRLMEVWYPSPSSSTTSSTVSGPPEMVTYTIDSLFSPTPPSDLPPYPSMALVHIASSKPEPEETTEALTYHPLLTDALHSLLLCHSLIGTPPKELTRHAYMVARLCRVADGYPIFLAARSPARADWMEVLKRTPARLDLSAPWEWLCAPAPLVGEGRKEDGGGRWAQEEGKEYPVSTERAGVVVRWIRDSEKRGGHSASGVGVPSAARRRKVKAIEAPPPPPSLPPSPPPLPPVVLDNTIKAG